MAKVVYFDDAGNAVGIGDEAVQQDQVDQRTLTRQTVAAVQGSHSERKEVIDDATFKDIKDPSKKLSLKSFKISKK